MSSSPDLHYAILGLDADCSADQIRTAYRLLAKQWHPDLHPQAPEALARTQALNAAYAILSDPERRAAYDRERATEGESSRPRGGAKAGRILRQDVSLALEDFLRGTTLEVRVKDPAHPGGPELYTLVVPPQTAPGTQFRLTRTAPWADGHVQVRLRAGPSFRFKPRGSDLRCDLKISPERAARGGVEYVTGLAGNRLAVKIPRGVGRHEILRIPGEGLPRVRGGRGDLLIRIEYRPEVRITRRPGA